MNNDDPEGLPAYLRRKITYISANTKKAADCASFNRWVLIAILAVSVIGLVHFW